jgi:ribonuclease E
MGLIIRTAGAARTKQEIKRDFEYLLRLWESVRDLTLRSQAPSLVYEEGNLIKRSIRDLYNKDVDEVIVAGDEAHREAKDFMRMLMPSHAKNVTLYAEPEPLFTRFQIERQLNAMFSPYVTLRSGGYLVINQTEALVAIDVNSGKATREFSIEETALHTNAEAADEIARQLKLRDLAGLIVIDFIDMEEKRNNRTVERRLKEALRFDRARIQVGRISHFGLLEMSRQRLRTGVLEGSTSQCPHCQGTGIIRSTESVALAVLRGLEDAITAGARTPLVATTTPSVALYILNNKRPFINDMETRHGLPISVTGSDKLAGANFTIEKGAAPAQPTRRPDRGAVNMEWGFEDEGEAVVEAEVDEAPSPAGSMIEEVGDDEREERDTRSGRGERSERGGSDEQRRRGRRRRRGGGGGGGGRRDESREGSRGGTEFRAGEQPYEAGEAPDRGEPREAVEASPERAGEGEGGQPRGEERGGRSRRRGRRGGRRGRDRQPRNGGNGHDGAGEQGGEAYAHAGGEQPFEGAPSVEPRAPQAESRSRPERSHERSRERTHERAPERSPERAQTVAEAEPSQPPPRNSEPSEAAAGEPVAEKRTRHRGSSSEPRIERIVVGQANDDAGSGAAPAEPSAPARKGWWQRRLGGE